MRNTELLEQVADQIEREPGLWRQMHFVQEVECGTAYCIGGWAAVLSGSEVRAMASSELVALLGFTFDEAEVVFFNGFEHERHEWAHKEVAEWLREIARGGDVAATAPAWWLDSEEDE